MRSTASPMKPTAHETHALPIPAGLSMVHAAAVPETFYQVWHNVFERGALEAGETLLVHGGSSGIGTTAIQLAKALGARVIVTAGSAEKCEACRRLGADVAVNYKTEDFVAVTKSSTGGAGANVILDMAGGDYIERNYEAAAAEGPGGRQGPCAGGIQRAYRKDRAYGVAGRRPNRLGLIGGGGATTQAAPICRPGAQLRLPGYPANGRNRASSARHSCTYVSSSLLKEGVQRTRRAGFRRNRPSRRCSAARPRHFESRRMAA